MELRNNIRPAQSLFRNLDWATIALYLIMVVSGLLSVYAASYDFDHASIFDGTEFSGKQVRWIGVAVATALLLLLIDVRVYETYSYIIYLLIVLLLFVTIFVAPNTNGSRSWLVLGPMRLQPAEFAKAATALTLAKLFSGYNFKLNASRKNYYKALAIILTPMLLIICQKETGSALVFAALFFVLYREGMSGLVLSAAAGAVALFVVAVKYSSDIFMGIPLGQAIVFIMLMVVLVGMLLFYCRETIAARNVMIGYLGLTAVVVACHYLGYDINGYLFFFPALGASLLYALFIAFKLKSRPVFVTIGAVLAGLLFLFSVDAAFGKLMPHQQLRIKVALGMEENLRGAGYNVNQSKIAIGSGGMFGKGFLNGTQTKLKYVPEQHTDFIFCTIGEERGFVGSVIVLVLFVALILRVISIAERQPSSFGRVYGYCVASYFLFHLAINIGMVIGLCPVIGIPLPFFSYGGSSLIGFTISLFILLRIDSARREQRSY